MRAQSTNSMPSLKVPLTVRTNSASSTPTVPICSDSINRIERVAGNTLASAAAAIQPAVPPPTITTSRIGEAFMLLVRCSRREKKGGPAESNGPAFPRLQFARRRDAVLPPHPHRELERARIAGDVAGGVVADRKEGRIGRRDVDEVLVVERI